MFDFECKAELRNVNLRAEAHGDEWQRAMDIKLMLLDVPLGKMLSLLPDWSAFYKNDELRLQELIPVVVHHKLENVQLDITAALTEPMSIKGCDIKKSAKIWPKPNKVANVELTVQCTHFFDDVLIWLADNQRETINVGFVERQLRLADMEQA